MERRQVWGVQTEEEEEKEYGEEEKGEEEEKEERLKHSYQSKWQAIFKFFTYFISFEVSKSHL